MSENMIAGKPIRFTAPIRRGLVLARGLLVDSFNPDATPSAVQVQRWTAKEQREFNRAMEWLEQVEADESQPDVCDPVAEIAASPTNLGGAA